MKTVTVEVTQDDIERGKQVSSDSSPLALAIRRAIGDGNVLVGRYDWMGSPEVSHRLPSTAFWFQEMFDQGRSVSPFTFELEVPDDV